MSSSLQQELWGAVEGSDGARYTELSNALDLTPVTRQERRPAVPIRLILVPSTGETERKLRYCIASYALSIYFSWSNFFRVLTLKLRNALEPT